MWDELTVEHDSPVPLHVQIRNALAEAIDRRELPAGSRLPTVRALAKQSGVALRTAAQAVELLKCEGRVTSHMGRGVFVTTRENFSALRHLYLCLHPAFLSAGAGARFRVIQGIIQKAQELGVEVHPITSAQEFDMRQVPHGNEVILFLDINYAADGFGEISQYALKHGVPACVADGRAAEHPGVLTHRDDAAALAAEHLLQLGHRRIGLLTREDAAAIPQTGQIRRGYERALRRHGVPTQAGLWATAPDLERYPATCTIEALDTLLGQLPPPTAIVCDSDRRALFVLECLNKRGVRVPEEISVIGHDNLPATGRSDPALTTVDARSPERGQKALMYVLGRLAGGNPPEPEVMPRLVVRASTASLGKAALILTRT